jgi:hypothetical protein
VKVCSGTGLDTLRRWLGDGDASILILHNGGGRPLVLASWDAWNRVAQTIINGAIPQGDMPDGHREPGYNHSVLARAL